MNLTRSLPTFSFRTIFIVSSLLRVSLILYSEWHDAHSVVKYTDVDYRVFSDATRYILNPGVPPGNHAKGPFGELFNLGDPYTRETYRYTPLLALLLAPNEWVHPSFGKYLFALCDLLNGLLIYNLLVSVILPWTSRRQDTQADSSKSPTPATVLDRPSPSSSPHASAATLYTSIHLLNPLVFTISTRGSSESVLSFFVLLTLYCALKDRWHAMAVLLGLSTHWKIYPVVYGVGLLGIVGTQHAKDPKGKERGWKAFLVTIINWRTILFGVVSAGTFLALGAICYLIWGYPFLYESYIYHIHRLDHRHNFSPYFYLTYLTYPSTSSSPSPSNIPVWIGDLLQSPLTSFAPQMILTLGAGLLFGRRKEDLVFTWFVQTVAFVLFNKVCTSQYFLWYLLLLSLLLPQLSIPPRRALVYLAVWIGTQALWLSEAYRLEFLGDQVFYGLWVRSLIYVLGNCWVLAGIMKGYKR